MNCRLETVQPQRKDRCRGMTLIEMLIALGIASIIFAAVGALSVYTAKSFAALGNYTALNQYSRNALDILSRDIREAKGLIAYQTNRLVFTNEDATTFTFAWDPSTGVLSRNKGGWTSVLLTNCDYLTFGIFQRNPSNNFSFYPATNSITGQLDPSLCKLVDVSWKCSRQIFGKKVNTESVQTAKIVMRN